MSAEERLAGDITEGAVYLKRGKPEVKPAKVTKSLEEALDQVKIEWEN